MTQEDCLAQIRHQLDAIQKSINAIEISQGISTALQQRQDTSIHELEIAIKSKTSKEEASKAHAKIDHDIAEIAARVHEGDRVLSQYQGDRKFILGIVATVTVIMGAINGVAMKMITSYFDDLENRLIAIDKASREKWQQSVYDATTNATEISNLKDRIIELQKGKTK